MFDISPHLYSHTYYWIAFSLCAFVFVRYLISSNNRLLLQHNSYLPTVLLCILAILFLGLRPTNYVFGDMVTYAKGYRLGQVTGIAIEAKGEWAFALLQQICINFHFKEKLFFLICSIGYIFCQYWSCKKLLWENVWIAMLFILSAFEFYVFAVNGVRNGLAVGMVMMAMTLMIQAGEKKIPYFIAALIVFFAYGIHRSIILPVAFSVVAMFWIKNPKYALWIWLGSIGLSLIAGGYFTNLLGGVASMEEKYHDYNVGGSSESSFSRSGYRWDFLIYSAVPVALIWFVNYKRQIRERVFDFFSVTYLLTNSAWVLINQVNYSNRFAYLSWFLLPLILAYGFIRLPLWPNQDRKVGLALLAHAGFTLGMFLIGKL